MPKHTVADLEGEPLDKAVALAEGYGGAFSSYGSYEEWAIANGWAPSTLWSDGGPIIERERIAIMPATGGAWLAILHTNRGLETLQDVAASPLVAAMRVHAAHKLGREVELP
jgi:hypothetical protein